MRIDLKLTLALVLPLVALTAFLGLAFQNRSRELLREELTREGRAIARVVQIASEDYLRDRQVSDLRQLADRITGYERVLGVRLFDQNGVLTYQPPSLSPYPFAHWKELQRVLAEKRTIQMRRSVGDETAVGFLVPLFNRRGQLIGVVQVLQLEAYIAEDERATLSFIIQLMLAMVAATLIVVLSVTRTNISRPISRLVRSFREVGSREVPSRVPVLGDDELGLLSREFNGMCERLEMARTNLAREQDHRRQIEAELRNAERLAGLGRLAAGLAHEIGTPLNVIIGRAESIRRMGVHGDPATRHLGIIISQGERIARIVRDMLDFARMKPRRHVAVDVRAVIRTVLEVVDHRLGQQQVSVEFTADEVARIHADSDQLQQVFLNLASNSMDAMPDGGRLQIAVTSASATNPERGGGAQDCVIVTWEDSGAGIAPENVRYVFDPFFTTKEAGRGTGLGLSVAYGIVEEHRGWFEVRSTKDSGTRFKMFLPIDPAPEA